MKSTAFDKFGLSGELQGAGYGKWIDCNGKILESISPVDMSVIGKIRLATKDDYEKVIKKSVDAFYEWRKVPAPKRGEIVRQIGEALRQNKKALGELVSIEVGKIRAEGEGEVQEMIDIADFAVGQSRMLYGLTIQSERPDHRMFEQWHPIGPVGVITAFNFPVAVWAWNAMLCLIAGDTVIWKPSSKAFVSAAAVMNIVWEVLEKNNLPRGIVNIVTGDRNEVGEAMLEDKRIPLISATGSVRMGRHISSKVAKRLGKTLLELGGNNAIIVTKSADMNLAIPAIVFGAVGTAGQRCTSTRRIIVHEDIKEALIKSLVNAYKQVKIGNPLDKETLMGPLIDKGAVDNMQKALEIAKSQCGKIIYGGDVLSGGIYDAGTYVSPCIMEAHADMPIINEETFAPLLYIISYKNFDEAIKIHNQVPQGLSSAIFTNDLRESEEFLSNRGSDCGISCVNLGTSGAEIGGAFGGEKDTGGGRESGSDAWKAYMRRQTCTINWSKDLPLAQGIEFNIN